MYLYLSMYLCIDLSIYMIVHRFKFPPSLHFDVLLSLSFSQCYRWSKYDDPVPGWELPASWASTDLEGDNDRFDWILKRCLYWILIRVILSCGISIFHLLMYILQFHTKLCYIVISNAVILFCYA